MGSEPMPDNRDRDDVTSRAATVNARKAIKVERSIQVQRPSEELYRLWRDFSNLPRFMKHLESVKCSDAMHLHRIARLPGGKHVEWDSEIVNDIPGQLIAWKTVGDPDIAHAGSVHFTPLSNSDATDGLSMTRNMRAMSSSVCGIYLTLAPSSALRIARGS